MMLLSSLLKTQCADENGNGNRSGSNKNEAVSLSRGEVDNLSIEKLERLRRGKECEITLFVILAMHEALSERQRKRV